MFTLSLVRRSKAGGGEDEAAFEDGIRASSGFCDLHCLLPRAKTEARWGNNTDIGYINYLCFLVCETKVV